MSAASLCRENRALRRQFRRGLGSLLIETQKFFHYMAANTLPSGIGDLFTLADRMERGLGVHGMWLLKGFTTVEEFGGLLKATREAERDFSLARAEKAASAKRSTAADEELTVWLAKARLVVMLALGSQWSESWIAAGFSHRGTNVPKRIALRMELARRVGEFFRAHPEYEVGFAGVTAERGRSLAQVIIAAQSEMQMAKASAIAKKRSRDVAEKKLRRAMSDIVGILPYAIEKSDPRWLEFGLKQPRPGTPVVRAVTSDESAAAPVSVDFQPVDQLIQAGNAAA